MANGSPRRRARHASRTGRLLRGRDGDGRGVWGKGNGRWPLNLYDSAVEVPAIVSLAGRVAAGVVRTELLSAYDLMATLLELAGLDPSPMQTWPGRSFAPLLLTPTDAGAPTPR